MSHFYLPRGKEPGLPVFRSDFWRMDEKVCPIQACLPCLKVRVLRSEMQAKLNNSYTKKLLVQKCDFLLHPNWVETGFNDQTVTLVVGDSQGHHVLGCSPALSCLPGDLRGSLRDSRLSWCAINLFPHQMCLSPKTWEEPKPLIIKPDIQRIKGLQVLYFFFQQERF